MRKFLLQYLTVETCEDYMFHPINTYHTLTRISNYLSKLVKLPSLYQKSLKNSIMIESQAAQGIINIQDFYDVNVMDIAKGNLKGIFFKNIFSKFLRSIFHTRFL